MAVLGCLIPFVPGLSGPFQHDDLSNLPSLVVGPFRWEALIEVAFRNESGPLRRPLSNVLLAINYWIHGIHYSPGFKAGNLLIHGLTGLAAYWLCLELFRARAFGALPLPRARVLALIAAAIWLLHPLQVSTALYIVQRMAQLATLFCFVAIAWIARETRLSEELQRPRNLRICIGFFAATVLATASKENGLLTVALAGATWFVLLSNLAPRTGAAAPALHRYRPAIYLCVLLPSLAAIAILAARPDLVLAGYLDRPWTLPDRLWTQSVVLWLYLKLIFVPMPSTMGLYHDVTTYQSGDLIALIAGAGLLLAMAVAVVGVRRHAVWSWAILWFAASHLMESTALPLEMIYEHRNYTGLLGFAVLIAWLLARASERFRVGLLQVCAIPLVLLASMTFSRSVDWSTPENFYAAEFRHHPHSFRALLGFYDRLKQTGAFPEVADHLEQEILDRRGEEPWVKLMLAGRQCESSEIEANWGEVRSSIRQAESLGRFVDYARAVQDQVFKGGCPGLDLDEFEQVLIQTYYRGLYGDDHASAAVSGSLIAWLNRHEGKTDKASYWFWRTTNAFPNAVEPLFDAAYMHLNQGQPEEVRKALNELWRRQDAYRLRISYRIEEVESHLEELERSLDEPLASPDQLRKPG